MLYEFPDRLLEKRPEHFNEAGEVINLDLNSNVSEAIGTAAEATRHWINLSAIHRAPETPAELLALLVRRIVFRRQPGIDLCLEHLTFLVLEQPLALTVPQVNMIIESLIAWHEATVLPMPPKGGHEFPEDERPNLRNLLGRLAGALWIWLKKSCSATVMPSGIALWHNSCASDPLPEVRRAFSFWDQLFVVYPATIPLSSKLKLSKPLASFKRNPRTAPHRG
jgi:hypothetical protein